jgi:hypothetical protein
VLFLKALNSSVSVSVSSVTISSVSVSI